MNDDFFFLPVQFLGCQYKRNCICLSSVKIGCRCTSEFSTKLCLSRRQNTKGRWLHQYQVVTKTRPLITLQFPQQWVTEEYQTALWEMVANNRSICPSCLPMRWKCSMIWQWLIELLASWQRYDLIFYLCWLWLFRFSPYVLNLMAKKTKKKNKNSLDF